LDVSASYDTGDTTAAELNANPQYVRDEAYAKLAGATVVYPFTMPFNRSLEVSRIYLRHLGAERHEVMRAFQVNGEPSDLAIACEYLAISAEEYVLLTQGDGTQPGQPVLREYYGYNSDSVTVPDLQNPSNSITIGWPEFLSQVPEFLRCTGLSYIDLVALVTTHFLNPNQVIRLQTPTSISDPDYPNDPTKQKAVDPCDLTLTVITNLDIPMLQRLHRFVRLWKKIGWEIADLDKASRALGVTDVDDALLIKLAYVKQLQSDLKLPLNDLLSFWTDIDTEGRDSLYIKLFQNKAVLKPVDPDFRLVYVAPLVSLPFAPDFPDLVKDRISYNAGQIRFVGSMSFGDREALLDPQFYASVASDSSYQLAIDNLFQMRWFTGNEVALYANNPSEATISKNTPTILAAVRVGAIDLAALRATELPDDALTLANLSKLYRWIALARALKISIANLVALTVLSGIEPFQPEDPASTISFVRIGKKVLQSYFSVTQLNYLYRHIEDPLRGGAPLQANIDVLIKNLQVGLKKVVEDTITVLDPTGDMLRQKLGMVLDSTLVDAAMSLVDGTAVYSEPLKTLPEIAFPDALNQKIAYDAKAANLNFVGAMTQAEQQLLLSLSANLAYSAAIKGLAQQPRAFISLNFMGFIDTGVYATALTSLLPVPLPDSLQGRLVFDTDAGELRFVGAMTDAERAQIELLSSDAAYTAAVNSLYQQPRSFHPPDVPQDPSTVIENIIGNPGLALDDRFYYFLTRVLAYLRDASSRSLIKQTLSENLKLDSALISLLIDGSTDPPARALLKSQLNPSEAAIADFLVLGMPKPYGLPPLPGDPAPNAAKSYLLLYKAALLITTFKMTVAEVAYLSAHSTDFGTFDLNVLPLDRLDPKQTDQLAVNLFAQWQRLSDLFTLRDTLPQGDVGLLDVFGASSIDDAVAKLSAATAWDSGEISTLIGSVVDPETNITIGFNLETNGFRNEIDLVKLRACWILIKRLGVSAKQLFKWAARQPDANQAQDIKNTAKTKYDDDAWLTVARPLNDVLRESQRTALVAYLLYSLRLKNSGELYEFLLIDVDIAPV
jgi:hypothetical protein